MKALVPATVVGAVILHAAPAWACGQCFGEGGGSVLGWLALGAFGLLVYRWFSKP